MKKALVLGSSGFIGGHLVKILIEDGYYVIGSDIRDIQYDIFTPTEFIKGDLRDINFVKKIFNTGFQYDEVYQLAADMGGATYINCGDFDGSVMSNSISINVNVAKCAVEFSANKLFFASSACVYPHNDKNIASCKETDAYPAFPDNEYGWEKLFSERMYKAFEKQYGLNVFIGRFHSIVGDYSVWNNERSKAHAALIYKIINVEDNGTIEVYGDGEQIRTFLYVKDCIKGIRTLINCNCKKILNIGSDKCITINQYISLIRDISGKKFNIKYIDGATGVKFRYCNIDEMKNECNWKPETSVEESAKITYNFIKNQIKPVIGFITQKIGYTTNTTNAFCGIGIRGKLISDILTKIPSNKYTFIRDFIDNNNDLEEFIKKYNPNVIIYNYHHLTMKWLDDRKLRNKYNNIKHIIVHYEFIQEMVDNFNPENHNGIKYIIIDNDKIKLTEKNNKNIFLTTRSIPFTNKVQIDENRIDPIPIIGYQGFAFHHKGIHRILDQIQKEFDEAIFRIHIPNSYYGSYQEKLDVIQDLKNKVYKSGIKLELSEDFLSDEDIILWLNKNTVNCYFYNYTNDRGISSSPDYSIAAYRPIAINNSEMFLNLHNLKPTIQIEQTSLKEIIKNGLTPLKPLYEKYKNENVLKDYENICDTLLH